MFYHIRESRRQPELNSRLALCGASDGFSSDQVHSEFGVSF